MDRAWKTFTDDATTYSSPVPPAVLEQQDQRFKGDFLTLLAGYRTELARTPRTAAGFAAQLNALGKRLLDDFGPNGLFEQQAYSERGPSILLRALAEAYDQPDHVLGDLEGD